MQVFVLVVPADWTDGGGETDVHAVYATDELARNAIIRLVNANADDLEFDTEEEKETHIEDEINRFTIDEFTVQTE
jgi:hypothetical protein